MVTEVLTIKFSELMPRYSFRRLPFAATALRGLKAMTVSFFVLFFFFQILSSEMHILFQSMIEKVEKMVKTMYVLPLSYLLLIETLG